MPKKRKTSSYERLRKHPMALYLEPTQYERLKRASATSLVPMQAILRQGLELILTTKYEKQEN
jgi:hypothetical protein